MSSNYFRQISQLIIVRIISRKILRNFWESHPDSEQSLKAWYHETKEETWNNPNQLKEKFHNASIIDNKRVVFNIVGNKYRLITDIEYKLKLVFIVWIGTHKDYDRIEI